MNERAKRIKKLVQESNKTYQELEKITGVAKSSLQRYASGATTKIPLDVVEKLEKAFGVPRGYIMGWQSEQEPQHEPDALADIAAKVLLDPDLLRMVEQYLELSEVDQYVARVTVTGLHSKYDKQKKTDANVSQEVEKVSLLETE